MTSGPYRAFLFSRREREKARNICRFFASAGSAKREAYRGFRFLSIRARRTSFRALRSKIAANPYRTLKTAYCNQRVRHLRLRVETSAERRQRDTR